jgi:hypothetical protein
LGGRVGRDCASAGETGERSSEQHCIELVLHGVFDLVWGWSGVSPRVGEGRMAGAIVEPLEFVHPAVLVVRNL